MYKNMMIGKILHRNSWLFVIYGIMSLSMSLSSSAAVTMYLKFEGKEILGESTQEKHQNEIDVLSWSWGMTHPVSVQAGGGSSAGRVNLYDINITKYIDRSTPSLMLITSKGEHIPKATLSIVKTSEEGEIPFMTITLEDVLITTINLGGNNVEDRSTESVSLNFNKVKIEYFIQNVDGSVGDPVVYEWNVQTNSAN